MFSQMSVCPQGGRSLFMGSLSRGLCPGGLSPGGLCVAVCILLECILVLIFCGATDTTVLDFWWRVASVSKPGWIPLQRNPHIYLWCNTCWRLWKLMTITIGFMNESLLNNFQVPTSRTIWSVLEEIDSGRTDSEGRPEAAPWTRKWEPQAVLEPAVQVRATSHD